MGKYHEGVPLVVFPEQKPTGIDLPQKGVELKVFNKCRNAVLLKQKDEKAKLYICYHEKDDKWYAVDSQDIPPIKTALRVKQQEIEYLARFQTSDEWEIRQFYEQLPDIEKDKN